MIIKVIQTCLTCFVEKNVPVASFYSFRLLGWYFTSRLHTLNYKAGIHSPNNRCVCHLRYFRVPKTHADV